MAAGESSPEKEEACLLRPVLPAFPCWTRISSLLDFWFQAGERIFTCRNDEAEVSHGAIAGWCQLWADSVQWRAAVSSTGVSKEHRRWDSFPDLSIGKLGGAHHPGTWRKRSHRSCFLNTSTHMGLGFGQVQAGQTHPRRREDCAGIHLCGSHWCWNISTFRSEVVEQEIRLLSSLRGLGDWRAERDRDREASRWQHHDGGESRRCRGSQFLGQTYGYRRGLQRHGGCRGQGAVFLLSISHYDSFQNSRMTLNELLLLLVIHKKSGDSTRQSLCLAYWREHHFVKQCCAGEVVANQPPSKGPRRCKPLIAQTLCQGSLLYVAATGLAKCRENCVISLILIVAPVVLWPSLSARCARQRASTGGHIPRASRWWTRKAPSERKLAKLNFGVDGASLEQVGSSEVSQLLRKYSHSVTVWHDENYALHILHVPHGWDPRVQILSTEVLFFQFHEKGFWLLDPRASLQDCHQYTLSFVPYKWSKPKDADITSRQMANRAKGATTAFLKVNLVTKKTGNEL